MRLDRDEVAGPEPAEVERGEDRHDRGARCLVAADLDPVAVRPDVVGLVDHPDRRATGSVRRRRRASWAPACVHGRPSDLSVDDGHLDRCLLAPETDGAVRPGNRDASPILLLCSLCHAEPARVNRPRLTRTAAGRRRSRHGCSGRAGTDVRRADGAVGRASSRPSRRRANGASATSRGRRGIPRSAAHRILHDMAGARAPRRRRRAGPLPGRRRTSPGSVMLVAEHLDVRRVGRPILEAAAAPIGETVVLALYDPVRRQFSAVDAVETSHPIRYIWESLRDWSDAPSRLVAARGSSRSSPEAEQARSSIGCPTRSRGATAIEGTSSGRAGRGPPAGLRRQPRRAIRWGGRCLGADSATPGARIVGDLIATWPDNRTSDAKETSCRRHRAGRRRRAVAPPGLERPAAASNGLSPAMTGPIRIGIVGAGRIVRAEHVPQVSRDPRRRARRRGQPNARIVEPRRRPSSASARWLDDWRQLVADPEIDAVLVGAWPIPPRAGHDRRARGRQARPDRGPDGGDRRGRPGDAAGIPRPPGPRRDGRPGIVLVVGRRDDPPAPGGRRDRPGPPRPGDAGTSSGPGEPGRLLALAAATSAARTSWPSGSSSEAMARWLGSAEAVTALTRVDRRSGTAIRPHRGRCPGPRPGHSSNTRTT